MASYIYNDDFVFTTNEKVVTNFIIAQNQGIGTYTETTSLTVSATANLGQHIMRAKTNWDENVPNDACEETNYGETEDYSINITSGAGLNDNPLAQVQVYPNPANEVLYVDLKDLENVSSIAILDINGKQIQELNKIQDGVNSFQIAGLKAGMYQVRIIQNGYQYTQRVIKL